MRPQDYDELIFGLEGLAVHIREAAAHLTAHGCAAACSNPEAVRAVGERLTQAGARCLQLADASDPAPGPTPVDG